MVPRGHIGITIFPFIFLKYKALKANFVLVNLEKTASSLGMSIQLESLRAPKLEAIAAFIGVVPQVVMFVMLSLGFSTSDAQILKVPLLLPPQSQPRI